MSDLQPVNPGKELWDFANALSRSTIIPKAFQNQPANCFVALDMANRLGASPMEIMQNVYVVHGTPGFSAKYAIGMANKSGVFKGPICFEQQGTGDKLSVTAYAIVRETGQRVEFTCDMAMAKAEKWTSNPKYRTMPHLMLRYRASTLLIRTSCPEVLLGMHTADELEDVRYAKAVPVQEDNPIAQLNAQLEPDEPESPSEDQPPSPDPEREAPPPAQDEIPF
ncbi:recombinase RecT [Limnobacter sp.]|uniref:recombinase RecT n=1 Tax=Limnobacter sp. TaxID=2003368 RepID=UPI0025C66226|nr:recombinase RecT [Limnobacter sp.]